MLNSREYSCGYAEVRFPMSFMDEKKTVCVVAQTVLIKSVSVACYG